MRLCLVGYGSIARSHMRALQGEDVDLAWVVGRLAEPTEEFAREYGFAHHTTDLATALDDPSVDAVLITSPSDIHAAQTEMALRAGKHVLCEIPLAMRLDDVDRLIALADQMDRRLMVCHTQRYHPSMIVARERIASGLVRPHHLIGRFMFLRRENVNWVGRRRSWTDNLLWHHGCHAVDTALWLLGATEVEVSGHLALPGKHLGIPMDLAIVMRTPQDQIINIAMSYNTHIPQHDYLIIGEDETLLATLRELRNQSTTLYAQREDAPDAIATQDREFLAAVREGREPAVSGRAVRPAMAALQKAQDQFDAWAPPGAVHPI